MSEDERDALARIQTYLNAESGVVALTDEHERTTLPKSLQTVLRDAVRELLDGRKIAVIPYDADLTTQEAADLLNVSRQYLVRLLDQGEIPFHTVGAHRRIRYVDLEEYREWRDARRDRLLTQLARDAREQGFYKPFEP
jgi:excisionase family DNA binding protein